MENKKERKAERNRIYYLENKEKSIQHQYEKRLCIDCNRFYHIYDMSRHNKTIKHITNKKWKTLKA